MAMDLSKYFNLNFFKRLDARARIVVLVAVTFAIILIVYLATVWIMGSTKTIGPSRVANAPSGLQSVPGGTLTAEYQRALVQANTQASEVATMTGTSAIPTMINPGGQGGPTGNCNIICSDQAVKINSSLDDWVRQGKVTPEVASALEKLAAANVSEDEFAAALDQLVKQGKLTPEQARELLAQYKKHHANSLLQDSANVMDALIKSGQLPLDAANELLTGQKNALSPAEYAAMVQRLVKEGKLSPAVAQQLIGQYTQQYAKEKRKKGIAGLQQMSRSGEITPEVLDQLSKLINQNIPIDDMAAALQKLVAAGKLTPAAAEKILANYKNQKAATSGLETIDDLIRQAEADANQELDMLLSLKKITPEVADSLHNLIKNKVPYATFAAQVEQFKSENKLTPEIAQLKLDDYKKITQLRGQRDRLAALQANNVSPADYASELKNAVSAGTITPEDAAKMMQEYIDLTSRAAAAAPAVGANSQQFAALQQRLNQGTPTGGNPQINGAEFNNARSEANQQLAAERLERINSLLGAMSGQATQLMNAWQPPTMQIVSGSGNYATGEQKGSSTASRSSQSNRSAANTTSGAPLIKAGSIIFAVLDTAINSDYPSSPIMATIVQGEYKGAKLLGKITTTKGVTGQMDRVMLNFTMMNRDEWTSSKSITAYAIDPDTARTVMATDVDYHYLMRYGAIFATSFIQGYANAIQISGGTTTTGIFGTSTQRPALSPGAKLATAIGQIGQNLGSVTQKYVERPPTVTVDSGVGIGILFMADVS